jgi:predicted transposase YdaD
LDIELAEKRGEKRGEVRGEKRGEERGEKRGEKKKAIEIAQYLISKRWKAEKIAEATKLDLDTVQSLYTTSSV